MFRTIARYEEDGLGLPYFVILKDAAQEEIDEATGERVGISVPDMEGLAVAVAVARALHPLQLAGAEVRFLRHVLGMTARQMAQVAELDPSTFSRWENDKQTIGEWADKAVRFMVIVALADRLPHSRLEPKALLGIRIVRRQGGDQWPQLEFCRWAHRSGVDGSADAWDALPKAA